MKCPNDTYRYNPFSNTCLRYVATFTTYTSAKASCESVGEYVATFETLNSHFWLNNIRRTDSGQSTSILEIALSLKKKHCNVCTKALKSKTFFGCAVI